MYGYRRVEWRWRKVTHACTAVGKMVIEWLACIGDVITIDCEARLDSLLPKYKVTVSVREGAAQCEVGMFEWEGCG